MTLTTLRLGEAAGSVVQNVSNEFLDSFLIAAHDLLEQCPHVDDDNQRRRRFCE